MSRISKHDYLQVGVSTYGGGLWHTWFDRDLTVAGRVLVRDAAGAIATKLVHVPGPILRIPNLAIHLDRGVADAFKFNNEDQLVPVLATLSNKPASSAALQADKEAGAHHHSALLAVLAKTLGVEPSAIEDLELSVVDCQPATIGGLDGDFVFAPRLDNLGMSFCGVAGLVASLPSLEACPNIRILGLFDHEEVGSASTQGAASSLMLDTLRRLTFASAEAGHAPDLFETAIRKSFLISADMAHACHPNYASKHEDNHKPKIGGGPVIKTNANQRYATNGLTGFLIRELGRRHAIPIQEFVSREIINK